MSPPPSPPPDPAAWRGFPHPAGRPPHWFFTAAGVVAAVVGTGFAVYLRTPRGVLIGCHVLAGILVLRLAVRRWRRQALALPVTPLYTLRGRAAVWLPLGAYAALSLMREGVLGEALTYDYYANRARWTHNWSTHSDYDVSTLGGPAGALRGLPVACTRPLGSNDGVDVRRGFNGYLRCPAGTSAGATVAFDLRAPDAFCHLPLYSSARVHYEVDMHLSWTSGGTHGGGNVRLQGDVDQTMLGLGSCRAFNELVGRVIAQTAVTELNAFLAAH